MQDSTRKTGYRLVGDVHFEEAKEKASLITPVPGGAAPLPSFAALRSGFGPRPCLHSYHPANTPLCVMSDGSRTLVCTQPPRVTRCDWGLVAGVGPMTIAMLLTNTVQGFKRCIGEA